MTITITDAGRQALVNAENSGTAPVTIAGIALGSGQYTPSATQAALTNEFKRIDTISGEVVADDTINVVLKDESSDDYQVGEFGLFTDAGVLFAVFSQPSGSGWVAEKNAGSSLLLAVDVVLETLDATSLNFGDLTFTNPPASETVKGVIEIADDQEAWDGEDDIKAMTPKKTRMVGVPAGALIPFMTSTAPTGYLKCNGAAVSRIAYSDLFAAIGTVGGAGDGVSTFNLPDSQNEFLRGASPDRNVGAKEADSLRSHGHSASSGSAGLHAHSGKATNAGYHAHQSKVITGENQDSGNHIRANDIGNAALRLGSVNNISPAGEHEHPLTINSAGEHAHPVTVSPSGGAETRPRSLTVLYCIKY